MDRRIRKKKHSRGCVGLFILGMFLIVCIIVSKFLASVIFNLADRYNVSDNALSPYKNVSTDISKNQKTELISTCIPA